MHIYIWQKLDEITNEYHTEAGIVVVAENITEAVNMIIENTRRGSVPESPDRAYLLDEVSHKVGICQPMIMVFPDAGCC